MAMTEKNALGRVLMASKQIYEELSKKDADFNEVALLDSLSAALSHAGNKSAPLGKLMGRLKREIKAAAKPIYPKVESCFSMFCPVLDYDYERALKHVPALIFGNDKICAKLVARKEDRARSMADAMKSYPGYLFGEFEALSDEQFYDLVFGYYPKLYDEPFMEEMRGLFSDNP